MDGAGLQAVSGVVGEVEASDPRLVPGGVVLRVLNESWLRVLVARAGGSERILRQPRVGRDVPVAGIGPLASALFLCRGIPRMPCGLAVSPHGIELECLFDAERGRTHRGRTRADGVHGAALMLFRSG